MTVREIYVFLDEFAPFSSAAEWDNSGFQLGDFNAQVTKALLCLDVTDHEIGLAQAYGAELILSHHPLIFHPLRQLETSSPYGRLLNAGISVISAHTNLDKARGGVNDCLCAALGMDFQKIAPPVAEGFLNVCTLSKSYAAAAFASLLHSRLHAAVRYVETDRPVERIAVCSGSGSDFIQEAASLGCDAYLTGDASYHDFLTADALGVTLFAAGHFETEAMFASGLLPALSQRFPTVEFLISDRKNPLKTVL